MKRYKLSYLILLFSMSVFAQEHPRNTGLSAPQEASTRPVSRASYPSISRKAKVEAKTQLIPAGSNEQIIANGWELIEAHKVSGGGKELSGPADTRNWYNAVVPGTVLTTLVEQEVYPDPYFGLNNMVIPDTLCRMDWWYRTAFERPETRSDDRIYLLLNGINYESDIWLNGQLLGKLKGAFIRGEYDITDLLKKTNYLAVHIIPPPNPGIPHEASALNPKGPNGGALCQDGPTFISSEGWDWMPGIRDRNIGVWQDVRLKVTGAARLIDPQVITDLPLPDTSSASLRILTKIECSREDGYILEIGVAGKQLSRKLNLKEGFNEITLTPKELKGLQLENPRLWWPNGYGPQNLYSMELKLLNSDQQTLDKKSIRFGVRELSYEFAVADDQVDFQRIDFNPLSAFEIQKEALFDNVNRVDYEHGIVLPSLHQGIEMKSFKKLEGDNPYLVIKVNGEPIFCKGGNWGMDDAMKRVSRERLEPYFKLHKEAHYTMIRNWTGESTEEVFYELADEYGMLIWNDFWMSTEGYNMPPADFDLFMTNATDVVRRFRNHPSIVLWCSRNEGYAPPGLDKRLADLVAKEDGTRLYQSNSRYLNLRPSGPWHYIPDINYYFARNADGFSTEVGTQSFPTAESMAAMMASEDLWPISDAWYYHDLHTGHQDYRAAIIDNYAEAYTLEDLMKKAQLLNYISHRAIFEAWNSKLWEDASGVLLWMTHPAWPSIIWQTYSSDYETHGAYFGAKKGCEPLHIQMNNHNRNVVVINTTLKAYPELFVAAAVLNEHGEILHEQKLTTEVAANAKTECFTLEIPGDLELPEVYFTKLTLADEARESLSDNFYWETKNWVHKFFRFNTFEKAELTANGEYQTDGGKMEGQLTLKNNSQVVALTLKMNLRNSATGERILPAYFSDGYFSLMPGEEKVLNFSCAETDLPSGFHITAEGYNVEKCTLLEWKR